MPSSYKKRYANYQLSSMLNEAINITGTLERKIPFKGRMSEKEIHDLILLNDSNGLLTTSNSILVINLNDGKVVSERRIFRQSPVLVDNESSIYFCDGYLFKHTATTLLEKKTRWIIPGYPGTYSSPKLIVPFEDFFISGLIQEPTPKAPNRYQYVLAARNYQNGSKKLWEVTYPCNVITPPLTNDNNLIICLLNSIEKISLDGKRIDTKKIEGTPLSCSISEGNNIYLIHDLRPFKKYLTLIKT